MIGKLTFPFLNIFNYLHLNIGTYPPTHDHAHRSLNNIARFAIIFYLQSVLGIVHTYVRDSRLCRPFNDLKTN